MSRITLIAVIVALTIGLLALGFVASNPILRMGLWLKLAGFPTEPPPLAHGLIAKSDWPGSLAANDRISDALQSRFPIGGAVAPLLQELVNEGFKIDPPQHGRYVARFGWGGAVCVQWFDVMWTEDAAHKLLTLEGSYAGECL